MSAEQESIATRVLERYKPLFQADPSSFADGDCPLQLPSFTTSELKNLCYLAQVSFSSSPMILELTSPMIIVGDLHGQILDLLRILREFGLPGPSRYLFLGDIVDRGEFSIETGTIIFALRVLYPENVFIIRGNHEFGQLCSRCGFYDEVINFYGSATVFQAFLDAFSYMPLLALIDDNILCVHGGIGPQWFSVNQVKKLNRPIDEFDDDIISSMLWSDPTEKAVDYDVSPRGMGHLFGESALTEFLDLNSRGMLVRGHECVQDGCQFMFNDRLATVFSASNYCGLVGNYAAVLKINENRRYEVKNFPPLQYLRRDSAIFDKLPDIADEKRHAKDLVSTSASMIHGLKQPLRPVMYTPSVTAGLVLCHNKMTRTEPQVRAETKLTKTKPMKLRIQNIQSAKRPVMYNRGFPD